MAKVVRMHGFGRPEVLSVDEVEVNAPGPGEVRVKVGSIGLNRAETMVMGRHFGQFSLPAPLGYEAASEIEAIGTGVRGLARASACRSFPACSR